MEIRSGKSVFKIVGMEAREFPQFPKFDSKEQIVITSDKFPKVGLFISLHGYKDLSELCQSLKYGCLTIGVEKDAADHASHPKR